MRSPCSSSKNCCTRWMSLEARAETRCIVLTGGGTKAFCAGADLADTGTQAHGNDRFRDARPRGARAHRDAPEARHRRAARLVHRRWIRAGDGVRRAHRVDDGEVPHRRRVSRRGPVVGHEPDAARALHRPQPHARHADPGRRPLGGESRRARPRDPRRSRRTLSTPKSRKSPRASLPARRSVFRAIKETVRAQYWDLACRPRTSSRRAGPS